MIKTNIPTENNNLFKEQTTLMLDTRGALCEGGSHFFNNSKKDLINCDLCEKHFDILTPTDFSTMVWIQGENIQAIHKNKDIKKFNLNLCRDCREKIFGSSVVTIKFKQELFEALKERGY